LAGLFQKVFWYLCEQKKVAEACRNHQAVIRMVFCANEGGKKYETKMEDCPGGIVSVPGSSVWLFLCLGSGEYGYGAV
jgi:hypothetical protein